MKALITSLLWAEIAAFAMLMLLFFVNTDKPYLLLVPVVEGVVGYLVFKALVRRMHSPRAAKTAAAFIALPIALGAVIAASVVGLLHVL